jgi:hypothetical protein
MKICQRSIKGKKTLENKRRKAKAFQSKLNFSKDSLITKLFGIELVDNTNKLRIIESIVQEICDLHKEVEETKGKIMHDIGFCKALKRALQAFYLYLPEKKKYIWGGVGYCEIIFKQSEKDILKLDNPCVLMK